MGIDFLDFSFRIEKEFLIKLDARKFDVAGLTFENITAGHLHQFVEAALVDAGLPVPPDCWKRVRSCLAATLSVLPTIIQPTTRLIDLGFA